MNSSVVRFVKRSPSEYKYSKLKGLFCIYKPPDMDLLDVYKKLKFHLVDGLNNEPCRPVEDIVKIDDETNQIFVAKNPADSVEGFYFYSISLFLLYIYYAFNHFIPFFYYYFHWIKQAIGYRYKRRDFNFDFLHPLTEHDSGVVITSINDDSNLLQKIENLRLMRVKNENNLKF